MLLSEVSLQQTALRVLAKPTDGLFLYLPHAFTGKTKFVANLLKSLLPLVDTEERFYDVAFSLVEYL